MCGFIGSISFNNKKNLKIEEANKLLTCRGPDQKKELSCNLKEKFNLNSNIYLNLIFNRLSILDLTDSASQPMVSTKHKTILVFNGEIYNHSSLRNDLIDAGETFESDHSDTEVVLNGLSLYGIDYVKKLRGMFAIVFFDPKKNKVYLVRDRLGQKPLFYNHNKSDFNFSSNLKSLVSLNKEYKINHQSLNEYFEKGVVNSPNTIIENISKVSPGHYIEIDTTDNKITSKTTQYWKLENYINNNKFEPGKFFKIFNESVSIRTKADVPVANFLSGGIDSTSIIKSQKLNDTQINTFSVSYTDEKYDESKWIETVVKKYNTNHMVKTLQEKNIDELVEDSVALFDEPYADPSTVPSFALTKLISSEYKVAISGDGGDELLGGYQRTVDTITKKKFPLKLIKMVFNYYPASFGTGIKILSRSTELEAAYKSYFSDLKFLNLLNIKNHESKKNIDIYDLEINDFKKLQLIEYKEYLTEMMMLKIDRTSMANSLEVRSPFVDHILIEYVLSTDISHIDLSKPKKILKDFLSEDFNNTFLNRKKMGFVFNIEKWIFSNTEIKEYKFPNLIGLGIDLSSYKKLFRFKTRTNALRIWRLLFIEKYLSDIYKLVN